MDKIPACKLFLETVIDFLLSVEDLCLSLNKAIDDIVSHDVRCRHCYLTRQNVNQNIDNRHEPGCQCLSLLRELQYCSFEQLKQINQTMNILNLFLICCLLLIPEAISSELNMHCPMERISRVCTKGSGVRIFNR